jgi:hypothetical protein
VAPSISDDGTNASATQCARRRQSIGAAAAGGATAAALSSTVPFVSTPARRTNSAQTAIRTTSST